MRHYKAKLQLDHSPNFIWLAIRARSIGEAVVITDSRTIDTSYRICDDSVSEITEAEYLFISSLHNPL